MNFIDLAMPLSPSTPVYPGDPKVEIDVAAQLQPDGYLDHVLKMGTHNGTHIDAPAHMVEDGKRLDGYPVEKFVGRGILLDVRAGLSLQLIDQAGVQPGDIVLLRTGASDRASHDDYYDFEPNLSLEAVRALVAKAPKMVGIDAGSIDGEPFAVHKALLGADILIIENLVNLGALEEKAFTVTALPLNVALEGSPARVVAQLT